MQASTTFLHCPANCKQRMLDDDLECRLRVKEDAELKCQLGLAMSNRPHHQLLQTVCRKKSAQKKRPQKQDNPDLYPIRNPCAQCSFIHTNLKIRRLHHLSQGGSVKKRYIKTDCVLLHREIVMYKMVGHPIITRHGENTATGRAGGEKCQLC